jgi:very-short-patch-repair endonuclease
MMRRKKTAPDSADRLWAALKRFNERGYHFHRHAPFHGFILDFVEHDAQLAIELKDGEPGRPSPDVARDAVLAAAGYTVLRFWKADAEANFPAMIEGIKRALEDHPLSC